MSKTLTATTIIDTES